MTDDLLSRDLQSVGMTAFVTHLDLFAGTLAHGAAAAELQHRMGITAKSSRSRVTKARAILKAGRRGDALDRIARSRLDDILRTAARAAM